MKREICFIHQFEGETYDVQCDVTIYPQGYEMDDIYITCDEQDVFLNNLDEELQAEIIEMVEKEASDFMACYHDVTHADY